ncbi:hypothetical protein M9H77_10736 [Catharanthus roseus]|uniref:Uncharacterized protein n=1 Tax=Catharanthus roseus TaxID=4058 RepID=A0ACC0BCL9_CATRO|nr:hypothetical protein M9H77_10736 [Catharanthus roseus]
MDSRERNACDDGRVYVHPIQSTAILDNKKRTSIFSPSSNPTKLSNTARTHIPKTPLHYSLTYLFLLRPCDSSRITAGSRAGAGAVSGAANGDDDGGSGGGGGARTGDGGDGGGARTGDGGDGDPFDTADVGVEKMRNGDHGRENIREGGVGDVKRKTGESKPWERRVCLPIYFNLFSSLINNY